jgi:predicted enzyme related to lactoylglutathione lyase
MQDDLPCCLLTGSMAEDPVVWWELASHDAAKAVAFFRQVFGWALEFDERAGFYVVPTGPQDQRAFGGGGIFTFPGAEPRHRPQWRQEV